MENHRSLCPMNLGLEVFGDRWTLLIIRDLMFDNKRYFREMLNSEEKIASNILTDRLNKLESMGVISKAQDPDHKQKIIYSLTEKGIDLMPIVIEIAVWSLKHRPVAEKDIAHVEELRDGGPQLQKKLMDELRATHLS